MTNIVYNFQHKTKNVGLIILLSIVKCCGVLGIDGYEVEVETDLSLGIPAFEIVGLGDTTVRESKERVRAAIKNTGFEFPTRRITINLAPASLRKEGSAFDLPIAVGIMAACGYIPSDALNEYMFVGELSLDGNIKAVTGVLPMAICAAENRVKYMVLSVQNAKEAAVVKDISVLPATCLGDIVRHFTKEAIIPAYEVDIDGIFSSQITSEVDFADVRGQENVKRAMEVAASGAHNLIMVGSPGSGKTMLARRMPTILPYLSFDEALEVTKIHSIAGTLPANTSLITTRPFRSPHHTTSAIGLIGGGKYPKPGEISLSHYGVLFLDEVPEFSKDALEVLRQPLEDGMVTISRVNASLSYPAKTTLILAANPCKCGKYLESKEECTCTPKQVQQYLGKLSGPLLDRIDIHIEVSSVKYNDLESTNKEEPSSIIRERVNKARKIQLERYKGLGIYSNSQLQPSMLSKYCYLNDHCKALLRNAFDRLGLSARAYSRILKVARTIADMEEEEAISKSHLAEAIQYRSLDRHFWQL